MEMYRRLYRPGRATQWLLTATSAVCLLLTLAALAGSVQQLVADSASYRLLAR